MEKIPDQLDTARAILNNPSEVFFDRKHKNYKHHQENLKMLAYKKVTPIFNDEYLIEPNRIKKFLDNNGKSDDELAIDIAKESLKQAEIANKKSRNSNIIAAFSILIALLALLKNFNVI